MNFAHAPILGLLLVAVPVLIAFLWWGWRRKEALAAEFIRARLRAQLVVGLSRRRETARLALLVAAVALILLALARPRWGYREESVQQRGLDIMVGIDTSRSMLAEDASPNRLRRAKLAALDLMRQAKTDRLGLIAFAGTAFLQCPLTLDDEAFRQNVEALDPGIIPQGGTALAEAIQTALQASTEAGENPQVLVLITDGEDHEPGALEAAQAAAQAGLRIFTVGVGSPEGEVLRERDESGVTRFLKDTEGNAIKSRLNESLLRQIAQTTGGIYAPLRGANVMEQLYEKGLAPLPKLEFAERRLQQYYERYQWPLGLAILLLIVEVLLALRLPAPKTRDTAGTITEVPPTATPAVPLLLFLSLLGLAGSVPCLASPASALRLYNQGQYPEAQQEYERLYQANTNDSRLTLNAGIAAYQAGRYAQATNRFQEAAQAPDLHLQQQAYYNLGNALYRAGEQSEPLKRALWEQAVTNYQNALALNKHDTNAEFNLQFVKRKIEELPAPPPSPSPQDQQSQQNTNAPPDQPNPQPQPKPGQNEDSNPQDPNANPQSKPDQNSQSQNDSKESPAPPKPQEAPPPPGQTNQPLSASADAESTNHPSGEMPPPGQAMAMTPEQAQRILDAQKAEEKALIFAPEDKRPPPSRPFKDW